MPTTVQRYSIDAVPNADQITSYREEAAETEASVEVTFPTSGGTKRLVVSPRGTAVLLEDVSEQTFNRALSAAEIAEALPA